MVHDVKQELWEQFKLIGWLIEFSYVMLTTVSGSPETLLWTKVILGFFLENLWNTLLPIFNFSQLKHLQSCKVHSTVQPFEVENFEVCHQMQAGENPVNKWSPCYTADILEPLWGEMWHRNRKGGKLAWAYQERFGSQYLNLKNFMYRNLIGVRSNICLIG